MPEKITIWPHVLTTTYISFTIWCTSNVKFLNYDENNEVLLSEYFYFIMPHVSHHVSHVVMEVFFRF